MGLQYLVIVPRFGTEGSRFAGGKENYEFCDLATGANPLLPNGGAWCNGTLQGVIASWLEFFLGGGGVIKRGGERNQVDRVLFWFCATGNKMEKRMWSLVLIFLFLLGGWEEHG